jgi:hypothetical protein
MPELVQMRQATRPVQTRPVLISYCKSCDRRCASSALRRPSFVIQIVLALAVVLMQHIFLDRALYCSACRSHYRLKYGVLFVVALVALLAFAMVALLLRESF